MVAIADHIEGWAPQASVGALRWAPSLRDVIVHVFYNRRIIAACLIGGLALGLTAAVLTPTQYTAEALLLVRTGAAEAAQQGLNGQPSPTLSGEAVQRILQSDIQIIRSDPVVRAAIVRMRGRPEVSPVQGLRGLIGLGPLPASHVETKKIAKFNRALQVSVEPNSNIIRVGYKSTNRARSLRAVQAVIDAYAERRVSLYVNGSRARQDEEIERYAALLQKTEAEIQAVRDQFDVLDIDRDMELASGRLETVSQRAAQSRERRGVVEAELGATDRTLERTPGQVLDSREESNAAPNDDARNTLLRLRQDRAHLAAQYQANWPGLTEIDAKIAAVEAQIEANSRDRYRSERQVRNPVWDQLAGRRAGLVIERGALARQSAELTAQLAEAQRRVEALRQADLRLHDLERSRTASESIYRALLLKRAGMRLEDQAVDDHNTTLRIVQPPVAPHAGRSLRWTLLLAGVLLGVGCAVAASAVATLLRQVFITGEEAAKVLGLPQLAEFDVTQSQFSLPAAEPIIERLATLLLDTEVDGRPLGLLQIVGDDAKRNLALALGRAFSRRGQGLTLIVDFDSTGQYSRSAPTDSVRRLRVADGHLDVALSATANLWVAVDLAQSPLGDVRTPVGDVKRAIATLRGSFSRVILVAHQDFAQHAARRLYPLVDANLMLVAAETTRVPTVVRIRETVLEAGGDLLGFVFAQRRHYIPEAIYRWL